MCHSLALTVNNKILSYRKEAALQGALYFGPKVEVVDNILPTLEV